MKNSEILTCHELKINKIEGSNDEDEYDPVELWNTVQEVSIKLLLIYLLFIILCIFVTLFFFGSRSLGNSYCCSKSSYSRNRL